MWLFILWLFGTIVTYAALEAETELDEILLSFLWPLTWLWLIKETLKSNVRWTVKRR